MKNKQNIKVLIITYYWPPAGGSGVQRWLFFVKYLREFGIEPVVFTVAHPNYPLNDVSMQGHIPKDIKVLKQKIWEPNTFFRKNQKKTSSGFIQANPNFIQKLALYIRANFFIPDARKFWIKPSVKFLTNYLTANPVDWIITTGPPHSAHIIGQMLKEKTKIKWLADFRDPWTEIDYFHQLPLSKKSLQKHKDLEEGVLSKANKIVVVGKTMQKNYSKFNANCHVITNGFDEENKRQYQLDNMFSLTHVGMLNADRNPTFFWESLRELLDKNPKIEKNIRINLIGKIAAEVQNSITKYQLDKYIYIIDYLPHEKVLEYQKRSQILLLFINNVPSAKGIITGKFFEYLKTQRPILAIGPKEGDLDYLIEKTKSGVLIDFEDKKLFKKTILTYFHDYSNGKLVANSKNIAEFSRKNLTIKLAKLLKK